MTTFHRLPVHHQAWQASACLQALDWLRLFFSQEANVGRLTPNVRWMPAYWSVPGRLTRSVLSVLQCIHVSVRERHVFRSLCTSIADCHWHCDRFLRCVGCRSFGMCR